MVEYETLCRSSKYGGGGIRTHGALADTLVFKTRALNHSTTSPIVLQSPTYEPYAVYVLLAKECLLASGGSFSLEH